MVAHPSAPGKIVALHIRHGDAHPLDFQYRDAYIPTPHYTSAAQDLLATHFPGADGAAQRERSVVVVASDDPDVYTDDELAGAVRAQSVIRLAAHPAPREDGGSDERGMFRR
ncbi:hypothetical protein V502_09887, partial [Pseudogymnoascus sp. VKM F-4520 (FW-2644)]